MTVYEAISLLTPVATFLMVVVAAWKAWRADKRAGLAEDRATEAAANARAAQKVGQETAVAVQGLAITVDGRLTELLKITGDSREAKGLKEGREQSEEIKTPMVEVVAEVANITTESVKKVKPKGTEP